MLGRLVTEAVNLDPGQQEPIPWSRALSQLEKLEPRGGSGGPTCWLSTVRSDGRPHVAGVVGLWQDDTLYFVSGRETRKNRNLALDQRCTFAISLPDLDLVLEGAAKQVTDPRTLARIADAYAARGWPLMYDGRSLSASFAAPTVPPPPWAMYAFNAHSALGVATANGPGATRWHFKPPAG
jgi:Pyridoxamine 5'-phosphate oxidase